MWFTQEILDFYQIDYTIVGSCFLFEKKGIRYVDIRKNSHLSGCNRKHHLKITEEFDKEGITLIQIFEHEVINKPKITASRIINFIGRIKDRVPARECVIKDVMPKCKNEFLQSNHIQGKDMASVRLGLYHNDNLVSLMTFSKNRICLGQKASEDSWELLRFCSLIDTLVIGAANKLLKFFEKEYKPQKIKTYADKRWSVGNMYRILGFQELKASEPNYWYFKTPEKLYHRFNFRKQELPKKLEKFNPNLTEWENMVENGWDRIWDCGNYVFQKEFKA